MHWKFTTIFLSLLIAIEVEGGCKCLILINFRHTSTPNSMNSKSTNIVEIGSNSNMNVRLVGGSEEGVGRLEINRKLGKWGSVCMDNWRLVNSLVVCRDLCRYFMRNRLL